MNEVELMQQLLNARREIRHPVDHAEYAQVLFNRQVAGQGSIDRRKIGAGESATSLTSNIHAADLNGSRGRRQDAKNHVYRCRLACPIRTEKADDFTRPNMKRDAV